MKPQEYNIDRLVGPTHNFGGLSADNVASTDNKDTPSNPKQAALEGLDKMYFLHQLGIPQIVLPPLVRPNFDLIKDLGIKGSLRNKLKNIWNQSPHLAEACFSSSGMWTANAGIISNSKDTEDSKIHFTPANLTSNLHRSIEAKENHNIFKDLFPNKKHFNIHPPLPSSLLDEGAANHCRVSPDTESHGINIFVYGHKNADSVKLGRQSLEAFQSIARHHQLKPEHTLYIRQNPEVIQQGAFHNDVVATSHLNYFLYHEHSYTDSSIVENDLRIKFEAMFHSPLRTECVSEKEIPLALAIKTYLFNSQIVSSKGEMVLIAPQQCQQSKRVSIYINKLLQSKTCPISNVHYLDINQSMKNGGGPACLRLRIILTEDQAACIPEDYLFSEERYKTLKSFITENYPSTIRRRELEDPDFITNLIDITTRLNRI